MTQGATRREKIITYLREQGGSIESGDGRGLTADIAKATGYSDLSTLNGMLARLEKESIISRDILGKRTFKITLVDDGRGAGATRRREAPARALATAAASPGVDELKQALERLETRVAGLESTLQAAIKKRRFWRAS